jgi:hypothetical protein
MTLEFWSTVASIGTFVVIAATAIAALVQLRHMRSSTQIAALNEIRETLESQEYQAAARFVTNTLPNLLNDDAARPRFEKFPLDADLQPIATVANFFEGVGTFVKYGIIDKDVALDLWGATIMRYWDQLAPFIVLRRRIFGQRPWENFEYLTVLARDHDSAHPDGLYPRGVRRILTDEAKS